MHISPPNRSGILRRRLAGLFFEHGREIVDIVVTHGFGDLGEVQFSLFDEPLGGTDTQVDEIGDDGFSRLIFKAALKLGDGNIVRLGDLLQGQLFRQMLLHIGFDLLGQRACVSQRACQHTGVHADVVTAAADVDKQLLQGIFDDLL